MRTLILASIALASACASAPNHAPRAHISEDFDLSLPLPPGYPQTSTIAQTVRARYGMLQAVFEAVLSLSPERVDIVVTAAGGPRLATIHWDESGVREERTLLAPEGVPVENLLADLFVSLWPIEAVAAALPAGVDLSVGENGARTLSAGGVAIMEVRREPGDTERVLVRNHALGYEISIVSQALD